MSSKPGNVIGIDLGGTRIKAGLVGAQGEIHLMENYLTCLELGEKKVLKRIAKIIKQLIIISNKNWIEPKMVGLGAPGVIDREKGIVHHSPNFPGWKEVPLARFITEEVGLPVYVDKDANVVTYGEKWVGAGQDLRNFISLTLGTGVGSGLILNGGPWYGSQGSGPEFGHITLEPRGERCGCGNRGCLETLASATYLIKKAQRGLAKKIPTQLSKGVSNSSNPLSAKILFETAQKGDPFCISLFADLGRYLGIALANIVHTLNIEGVVLGGGVSNAYTIFLPYLEKEFKKRLTMSSAESVSIRISFLGEKSGVLGAAKMAMDRNKR